MKQIFLFFLSDDLRLKYAFFYRSMYQVLEDGWTAFTVDSEFNKLIKGDEWRISNVNADFLVTYLDYF